MRSDEPGTAAGREMSQARFGTDIAGLASLAEPTRRALYLYVCGQGSAVSRDEAAAGVGVPRHSAKFHLDKLVGDGLLDVEFARRTGRQGPGAGRRGGRAWPDVRLPGPGARCAARTPPRAGRRRRACRDGTWPGAAARQPRRQPRPG